MSTNLKPGTDEYNRAANLIADVNLSIDCFLQKLGFLQKAYYNITDKNLNENLVRVVDAIDLFCEKEPEDINSHDKTKINFELNGLGNVYVCNLCNRGIGEKFKDIKRHLSEENHRFLLDKKSKAKNSKNMISVNENDTSNLANPKQRQISVENSKNKSRRGESRVKDARKTNDEVKNTKTAEMNLPKKAKNFVSGDFSLFLQNATTYGNKLKVIPAYEDLEKSLLAAVKPYYPDAKCHFFGSRINGLGTVNSDLDIFLNIGNVFNLYGEHNSAVVKKMEKVREILQALSTEWKTFTVVKSARVPVLKVYNKLHRIECDIAFSNGLGPCNTLLMKYLFELQPLCHKMCLFVKEWLTATSLRTAQISNVSTYSMALMVVFYLQMKNILPSVEVLQQRVETPLLIGPWQGNFIEKQLKDLKLQKHDDSYASCQRHLSAFFEFYAIFDFKILVVSPYLGVPIRKDIFNTENNPMKRYFTYYKENREANSFQVDRAICVQDPFEQNHNVTKGISEGFLKILRQYFELTAKEFKAQQKNESKVAL